MLKFCLLFGLSCAFLCVSSSPMKTLGTSETNWKCPPVAKVGTTCQCDEQMSSIHCNGATYAEMERFFGELKSNNPDDGVHVDLFRMENYTNATLDVIIFSPCTKYSSGSYSTCIASTPLAFNTMDFRGNRELKYLACWMSPNFQDQKINVKNLLLADCSLSYGDDFNTQDAFRSGLYLLGKALERIDLSRNQLTAIKRDTFSSYDWPNLKIFNISRNRITDFAYAWFLSTPNVDVIDLSHNYIQNIRAEAFNMDNPFPHKLDVEILIDMTNNRLTETSTFDRTIFVDLKRPARLLLTQNDFNHLPKDGFQSFLNKRDSFIDISDNHLICDCQSEWLRSMALVYESKMRNYNCLNLNNGSIFQVEKNLCVNGGCQR